MLRAAFLPWPTATVTVRSDGHHVAAGEDARCPVIMFGPTFTTPSLDFEARHAVEQRQIDVLAEREHQRVGLDRLELAGGLRETLLVERHLLDRDRAFLGLLDRREPLHHHAFLQRLLELGFVRRHLLARAAIDDHRLARRRAAWPCARRRARCCRRRTRPRAGRAAASPRLPCERSTRHGIEDARRARRRGCTRACRCARRRRGRRRRTRRPSSFEHVVDLGIELELDAQVEDARTSASSTSRGSRYFGMPKRIMPPASGPGFVDRHACPSARRWYAADRPDGPAPTTSTRLPSAARGRSNCQPCLIASSPRNRSTELMPTALSSVARLHAVSHG